MMSYLEEGLLLTQQLAIFLQLYGADSWVRRTSILPRCECWLSKGIAVSVHIASIYKWSTILCLPTQTVLHEVNFCWLIQVCCGIGCR